MRCIICSVIIVTLVASIFAVLAPPVIADRSAGLTYLMNGANTLSAGTATVCFTKNTGQWPSSILFRANANGAILWFTKSSVLYQLSRHETLSDLTAPIGKLDQNVLDGFVSDQLEENPERVLDKTVRKFVKTVFVRTNPDVRIETGEMLEYKCNYFLGNDRSHWAIDVPNYTSISYKEIYPGIDLNFVSSGDRMEYNFVSAPGANLRRVKFEYEGADEVYVDGERRVIARTDWGDVAVIGAPLATDAAVGRGYGGMAAVASSQTSGVTLDYSTFLGGGYIDYAQRIAVDNSGAAYIFGFTESADFPDTNAYDPSYNGDQDSIVIDSSVQPWDTTKIIDCSCYDEFVAKLSPSGNSLVYSTFLGSCMWDWAIDLAIDDSGSVYLISGSDENNFHPFPAWNPYDSNVGCNSCNGGGAFLTKLSPSGNTLVYSWCLDTLGLLGSATIAVDGSGCAYITTGSQVAKLTPSGDSVIYRFSLSNIGVSAGTIAVDSSGSAYVTGSVQSSGHATSNAYDTSYNGGTDVFVAKLSTSGNSLVYGTYIGGPYLEKGGGIAVDNTGSVYITGRVDSSGLPTPNGYDASHNGNRDAFVAKLSSSGNSLIYGTYLGGTGNDYYMGITADNSGSAYVTGVTFSSNFPSTHFAYDTSYSDGGDAFVTKVSPSGQWFVYSTFLGSTEHDVGYDIAVDESGSAFVVGDVTSSDFPMLNGYDTSYNGGGDAFVAKLHWEQCCVATTGNVDCDSEDVVDISDYSALYYFLYFGTPLCCPEEADVDGDRHIDGDDLTALYDYLWNSGSLAVCQ